MSKARSLTKAAVARSTTKGIREFLVGYRALLEDALREEGLSLPQLRLLHAVEEQTEVSAASIARRCQVTPQTLQAMLSRAVREGWIVRGTSPRNLRILTASLTAEGRALLQRGEAMAALIEAKLWKAVTTVELEQFNFLLEASLTRLRTELSQKHAE